MLDPYAELMTLVPPSVGLQRSDLLLDTLLRAMARGWTVPQLATECTRSMLGVGNPAGVAMTRLRAAEHRDPPGPGTSWRQPIPWCGQCDDARTRWRDMPNSRGVTRCWDCWTTPPPATRS